MDEDERRRRRLESYKRYNDSLKGERRRRRYENQHPERRERWSEIMRIKARDRK